MALTALPFDDQWPIVMPGTQVTCPCQVVPRGSQLAWLGSSVAFLAQPSPGLHSTRVGLGAWFGRGPVRDLAGGLAGCVGRQVAAHFGGWQWGPGPLPPQTHHTSGTAPPIPPSHPPHMAAPRAPHPPTHPTRHARQGDTSAQHAQQAQQARPGPPLVRRHTCSRGVHIGWCTCVLMQLAVLPRAIVPKDCC